MQRQFPDSLHDLLIERYCTEARALIEQARDREEGERVTREFCARMELECQSSLVVKASRIYADTLLKQRWGGT